MNLKKKKIRVINQHLLSPYYAPYYVSGPYNRALEIKSLRHWMQLTIDRNLTKPVGKREECTVDMNKQVTSVVVQWASRAAETRVLSLPARLSSASLCTSASCCQTSFLHVTGE